MDLRRAALLRWLLGLALIWAVAACAGKRPSWNDGSPVILDPVSEVAVTLLDDNSAGERCRLEKMSRTANGKSIPSSEDEIRYQIKCGLWSTPSATLLIAPAYIDVTPGGAYWTQKIGDMVRCEDPTGLMIEAFDLGRIYDCELREGRWSVKAYTLKAGNSWYVAYGVPAARPPIFSAVEQFSGTRAEGSERDDAKKVGARGVTLAQLDAQLAEQTYTAGSVDTFDGAMKAAALNNAAGDYQAAEDYYRKAMTVMRTGSAPDSPSVADPMMRLALVLSNQSRFREADQYFDAAERLVRDDFNPLASARLKMHRAMHLGQKNECSLGLELLGKAQQDLIDRGGLSNDPDNPIVLSGLQAAADAEFVLSMIVEGWLRVCEADLEEARAVADRALLQAGQLGKLPAEWLARIESLRAEILRLEGQYRAGGQALDRAIRVYEKEAPNSRPVAIDQLSQGEIQMLRGRYKEANGSCDASLDKLRDIGDGADENSLMPCMKSLYALAEREPEKAASYKKEMFRVAQMRRDTTTVRTIAELAVRAGATTEETSKLLHDIRDAKAEAIALTTRIDEIQLGAQPELFGSELSDLSARREAVWRKQVEMERALESLIPRYGYLTRRPEAADEIIETLQEDEAMLVILIAERESVALLLTRDGVEPVFRDLGRSEIVSAVNELRRGLVDDGDGKLPAFDLGLSHALYNAFLQPFEEALSDKGHLIVVPSGPLLSMPFGLLVRTQTLEGMRDYSQVDWLARHFAISTLPSADSLTQLRRRAVPSNAEYPLIGFGNFSPRPRGRVAPGLSCEERIEWFASHAPALPETEGELRAVARSLGATGSDLRFGQQFTEEAIRSESLAQYKVVYFAAHGFLPSEDGCLNEPGLLATPLEQEGEKEANSADGILLMSDVIQLKLNADLVVLSACNSGSADGEGGESLSGLARSFFFSGARGVIASHWYVDSKSTQDLMAELFDIQQSDGVGYAEAMRRSRMKLIQDPRRAHPAYWAGFTVIGGAAQ